ncbi:orotate phosphoribosyltransferase [Oligoflexaceae bacterium]|nr:orotate phosphoribosyltransferase [Oligoflexaceae bacterium]
MTELKKAFVQLLCESQMIKFGSFQTKAGRTSPYFINSGMICKSDHIRRCGEIYAQTLVHKFGNSTKHLYGPAYKGIPLVTMTAASLGQLGYKNYTSTFNRKEAKDHGEKGVLVGQPLNAGDKVIIIEDVLSRGTSFKDTIELLKRMDVSVAGLLVGVDRQEQGFGNEIASVEISKVWNIPVVSIINMTELTTVLRESDEIKASFGIDEKVITGIDQYLQKWNSAR